MPKKKKSTERLNFAMAVIGGQGVGKSTFTRGLVDDYHPSKKRLIVDVNDAPPYADLESIQISQIRNWMDMESGSLIKRWNPTDKRAGIDFLIQKNNVHDGLVVLEDCTGYIPPNPSYDVRQFMVDRRMHNLDLIFTFHALGFIPPFFRRFLTHIILFKTGDGELPMEPSFRKHWNHGDELVESYIQVRKNRDRHFYKIIETGL